MPPSPFLPHKNTLHNANNNMYGSPTEYSRAMKLPLLNSSLHSLPSSTSSSSTNVTEAGGSILRKRELFAYVIILVQACALFVAVLPNDAMSRTLMVGSKGSTSLRTKFSSSFPALSINDKHPDYHQGQPNDPNNNKVPMYEAPIVHQHNSQHQILQQQPAPSLSSVVVERVWHSKGSPMVNEGLLKGSCWCSGDDYCMCTPALAIDVILTSGSDHVWLVERLNGQFALMGGYVEVAESVEDAAVRELQEEMNVQLERKDFVLLGIYSDPRRDARRHATSVAFVAEIPESMTPHPGDDAKKVMRVALDQIDNLDLFIDHKTILQDYKKLMEHKTRSTLESQGNHALAPVAALAPGLDDPYKRSVCSLL